MDKEEIIKNMYDAVLDLDSQKAVKNAKKVLEKNIDPFDAIENGLTKGLRTMGEKFAREEIFIPHLMVAAEVAKEAMAILEPSMAGKAPKVKKFKVLVGTVEQDLHDLGKNLVVTMLKVNGFEVHDLGKDVSTKLFIEKTKEVKPDVVGLSALMTTTMLEQEKIIKLLVKEGLRDKVKVVVGGAPISPEWAKRIGADGYAENALDAVKEIKKALGIE